MKYYLVFVFSVLALFLVITQAGYPEDSLPFLQTQGQDILAERGNKVFLRGINWGGWLMWEGGVYGLPNIPEHQLRHMMEEKMGKYRADLFFDLVRDNFILPEDLCTVKGMGLNFVRVPFHHRYVRKGQFTKLDEVIQWARQQGVYVILDMHAAPGSQNPDYHSNSGGTALFWDNPEYQQEFIRLWEVLARRYKDEPVVAGYELLNEPVTDNKRLAELYKNAISRIREIDKRHIIFLDGNNYASDFSVFQQGFDDNIVYVFHTYAPPKEVQDQVREYLKQQGLFRGPMMCSEYGNPMLSHFFESKDIHWAPWTYKSHLNEAQFYSLPNNHPWRKWLDAIGLKVRENTGRIKREFLESLHESSISEEAREEFIRIINNPDLDLKEQTLSLAKGYPDDAKELKKVYLKLQEMIYYFRIHVIIDSIQAMSDVEMRTLVESLQTRYWERSDT